MWPNTKSYIYLRHEIFFGMITCRSDTYALAIGTRVWLQFYGGVRLSASSLPSTSIELTRSDVTCARGDSARR